MATATPEKPRRTASREARRRQLIDATMKCIARKGMGSTTLGDVAGEAGLSQGIVNLHFESKDNLLKETLGALANEYRDKFDKALRNSGPHPTEKLLAIMEHDLRPSICNQRKLAIWFAFWGEVKSRPTYRRMCDEWDQYYDDVVAGFCEELIEDGGYIDVEANIVANALAAITNGLWLSCLISPQSWDRDEAKKVWMSYLRGVFPRHFR
jgi:TetR/AcrR family transcriptional regulator, transcriptional repressor of bet genes